MILAFALLLAGPQTASDQPFLDSHAQSADVATLPSVQYRIVKRGPDGPHPARTDAVKVRYTGTYPDGSVFDTSVGKTDEGTAIFPLRGLIPGFQAALMQMRRGDRWQIVIPAQLAYGVTGHPLAGRALVFDLELVDFAAMPPAPPPPMTELPGK